MEGKPNWEGSSPENCRGNTHQGSSPWLSVRYTCAVVAQHGRRAKLRTSTMQLRMLPAASDRYRERSRGSLVGRPAVARALAMAGGTVPCIGRSGGMRAQVSEA